jgi:hypothetical protein
LIWNPIQYHPQRKGSPLINHQKLWRAITRLHEVGGLLEVHNKIKNKNKFHSRFLLNFPKIKDCVQKLEEVMRTSSGEDFRSAASSFLSDHSHTLKQVRVLSSQIEEYETSTVDPAKILKAIHQLYVRSLVMIPPQDILKISSNKKKKDW